MSSTVAPRSLAASLAARARAPTSTSDDSSTPRASMRARERISPSRASMRAVASRMRATKRRASSGSASAPSSSTSALARTAATGFFSSCDRSAAKVSRKGRPSSSRRIESMARVRRFTSLPWTMGGTTLVSPSLTRTAKFGEPLDGRCDGAPDHGGGERGRGAERHADDEHGGREVGQEAPHDDGRLEHADGADHAPVDDDRCLDDDGARFLRALAENDAPLRIEQDEVDGFSFSFAPQGFGDVLNRDRARAHLRSDEARDGLRLVARGFGGEQGGARFDAIEHQADRRRARRPPRCRPGR